MPPDRHRSAFGFPRLQRIGLPGTVVPARPIVEQVVRANGEGDQRNHGRIAGHRKASIGNRSSVLVRKLRALPRACFLPAQARF
jgi:hypothetical protein